MTTPGPNGHPNGHNPAQQAQQDQASAFAMQMQRTMQEQQGKLTAQIQSNVATMNELAGKGIRIDPAQLLNVRIDMLIQAIANGLGPQGGLWALGCNLAFEERIGEILQHAQAEGTKAVLAQGGTLSPAAIRDLAKQTGTFGGIKPGGK